MNFASTGQSSFPKESKKNYQLRALSHGAIFLAICNAILFLVDVKLANTMFPSQFTNIILTYQYHIGVRGRGGESAQFSQKY